MSPVGSREAFSSRRVTVAEWPAGTRAGLMERVQLSRYRARPAAILASSGSAISASPTLSRARVPRSSPARMVAAPAVRNDVPRVVNPASSDDRIAEAFRSGCRIPIYAGLSPRSAGQRRLAAGKRQALHDLGQDLLGQLPAHQRL